MKKPSRGAGAGLRPGRSAATTGTRRVLSTDEQGVSPAEPTLRQPDERDQSADQQASPPREVMKRAHDDVQSGQQDTDCRNRVADVLPNAPKTPQNFDEADKTDTAPRVDRKDEPKRAPG